jgi:hypothetical protein
MLFFLKLFPLLRLFPRNLQLFLQTLNLILQLLHIPLNLLILKHLQLLLLLIFNIPQKLDLLLQLINSLILHLNLIFQHINPTYNQKITCPKTMLISPWLSNSVARSCTFRFVCRRWRVTFLCFIKILVVGWVGILRMICFGVCCVVLRFSWLVSRFVSLGSRLVNGLFGLGALFWFFYIKDYQLLVAAL